MGYFVGLRGETFQDITVRYRRSGIFAGNSCINTAHNSATYLFPRNTAYIIVNELGKFMTSNVTNYSYWEDTLNRPVPNFSSLKASERAYLYIPSGL